MRSICFYFQVHQPFRLRTYRFFDIGEKHDYYDEYNNRLIMQRIAEKSYLPMNQLLLDLIKEYGSAFKVSFSISGMALEQFSMYAPEVLSSFKKLARTGNVEFLAETYAHSLSALKDKDEFVSQVEMHANKIESLFGVKPTAFRNTELVYSDEIGKTVADMGYGLMLTEGAKHILGWKSPNFLYTNARNPKLKLLLKNYRLSDDIAFRFSQQSWSEWPLTTTKFVNWLNAIDPADEVVNLFMDYETFGEHQWENTGIFDFMSKLPGKVFANTNYEFNTPTELSEKLQPVGPVSVNYPISWADEERDLTAWLGNELQQEAFNKLYNLKEKVKTSTDTDIKKDWLYLQNSDHFYYMSTKWFSDGDVHKYFNPYSSPYDAFINYMNVLSDFIIRVENDATGEELKDAATELVDKAGKYTKKQANKVAGKVKKKVNQARDYKFDDIKELSNARIKKLLKEMEIEKLSIAMRDAEKEVVEKVIPNLTKTARKTFDELQKEAKRISKTDVKKYRKAVEDKLKEIFG